MKKTSLITISRDVKLIKTAGKITRIAKFFSIVPTIAVLAVLVFDTAKLIKNS